MRGMENFDLVLNFNNKILIVEAILFFPNNIKKHQIKFTSINQKIFANLQI